MVKIKWDRIVNIWNSLPNSVVDACTVNAFKARLEIFSSNMSSFHMHGTYLELNTAKIETKMRNTVFFLSFWKHQSVKFDFTADLTGTGNRSEEVVK